jgi:hypothetical protein
MNQEIIVCETCEDTRTVLNDKNLVVDCPDCAVCEHCNGTGVYENDDETEQTCVCRVADAVDAEMIKGGEEQHDRGL